jgi:hypothetical protein
MKRTILASLVLILSVQLQATDLVVENGGISPAYGSISAAVAAASNGDRIIIKNRPGNIPWIEDVTIDKSLELLSFDNDTFFVVQGNYTITGFPGMEVNIIGMRNLVGYVTTNAHINGNTATIKIMDSKFESGYLNFTQDNYHLTVAGCELLDGYIQFEQGGIYGSEIIDNRSGGLIHIVSSGGLGSIEDPTIDIVGNKLTNASSSSTSAGIWSSGQQAYLNISNNYIFYGEMGIYLTNVSNGDSLMNKIYNNTFRTTSSYSEAIFTSYSTSGSPILEIMNNVMDVTSTNNTYGILLSSFQGIVNIYYNHIDATNTYEINGNPTFQGNNTTNATVNVNTDGTLLSGSAQINAGNPDLSLSDIDLSAGDPGAYGGSHTLDNYFPLFNGSARVYHLEWEPQLRQGNSLNIKGYSYDR